MLLVALSSLVHASPLVHDHGRIQHDLDAGLIDEGDALFLRFQQHFDPEGVPAEYAVEVSEGWACGTGLVMDLVQRWDELEPWQQERIDSVLVPWGGTLVDPMEDVDLSDEPPPPAATKTCFGRTYGDSTLATEHFMVEYESGVSDNTAEKLAEALEVGWEGMVAEHGWDDVIRNDDYLIMVYISNDNGSGAYTWYESCAQGGWMPYIVTYENTIATGNWYKSMAPHEYNHAQQMSYGWTHEFWYWEATATYIEELAVPNLNGWNSYIQYGYGEQPHISMRASDQQDQDEFWHMYGMAVWPFYLAEYHGGQETVRETWENAGRGDDYYEYAPWDVLDDVGIDFDEAYREFIAANTVYAYEEGWDMGKVSLAETISSSPGSGSVSGNKRPETYGQNFVKFKPGAVGDQPDLEVSFTGESGGEWIALLVGTEGDEVLEVVEFELSDEAGTAVLEDMADFDAAYLVVSPTKGNQKRFEWSFTSQGIGVEDPGGDSGDPGVGPGNNGNGNNRPADLNAGGCGCASSTGGGALGFGVLLAGVALLRRRD